MSGSSLKASLAPRARPRALLLCAALLLLTTAAGTTAPSEGSAATGATAAVQTRGPALRTTFEQLPGDAGLTQVTALGDNAQAWAERWRLMSSARHTLDASYFIVSGDVFGRAFVAKLYERAQQGVAVRLLIDGRGSAPLALPFTGLDDLQELAATGNADVRVYNPPLLQLPRTALERSAVPVSAGTHHKLLVVDDEAAITGGRNVGAVYFAGEGEQEDTVVDADVLVTGAAAAALGDVVRVEHGRWYEERVRRDLINFRDRGDILLMIDAAMDAWLNGIVPIAPASTAARSLELVVGKAVPNGSLDAEAELHAYVLELVQFRSLHGAAHSDAGSAATAETRVIASAGRAAEHDEKANDAIIRSFASARSRIWIQSPYFMMTSRLIAALERASARGVEIFAVTNSPTSSDNDASQALFIDTWPELQARIPTLRVFAGAGRMLHVKRIVIDDTLTIMGSHNLDPMSENLNSELVLALWSREFNAAATRSIRALLDGGEVYEYSIRRRPDGAPVRARDGTVEVAFGPRNHLAAKRLEELRALKQFLFSVRGIWDFEWVAW